ncbi:MAG: isoaspartyl peptidase/L-asparaginase [Pseudomonadota bacterium]
MTDSRSPWSLVVHGGAGQILRDRITPVQDADIRAALSLALATGGALLESGASAVDAVEAAVKVLEDDPNFNSGRGAVFTYEGRNELDAAIMDGNTRAAGAVAGATRTRNPVSLARAVMVKSHHIMLSGIGADQFSVEHGLEQVDPAWFATPQRLADLEELKAAGSDGYDVDLKYGTVGAVAVDVNGHVAAATSTGGITGKRWGRIGDSPLIGAGTYADDRACAVSATGAGEFFIREGVAHQICARVRLAGDTVQSAADTVMGAVKDLGGNGGVIVAAPDGEACWSFTTPGMFRGRLCAHGIAEIAVYGDE